MTVVASTTLTTLTITVHHTAADTDATERILTIAVFPAVLVIIVLVLFVLAIYSYLRWCRQRTMAIRETVIYTQTADNGKYSYNV